MQPVDVLVWLLAAQVVISGVGLTLLAFSVWKAWRLADRLVKTAAGMAWQTEKLAELYARAAGSIELTASAAAASTVAIQTLVRDLRPVARTPSGEEFSGLN